MAVLTDNAKMAKTTDFRARSLMLKLIPGSVKVQDCDAQITIDDNDEVVLLAWYMLVGEEENTKAAWSYTKYDCCNEPVWVRVEDDAVAQYDGILW